MKHFYNNTFNPALPGEVVGAWTGQQHGLLGKVGHGVTQGVGEVHGVVDGGVMKLHVDGVVLLVVVASHYPHRVPHLDSVGCMRKETHSGKMEV